MPRSGRYKETDSYDKNQLHFHSCSSKMKKTTKIQGSRDITPGQNNEEIFCCTGRRTRLSSNNSFNFRHHWLPFWWPSSYSILLQNSLLKYRAHVLQEVSCSSVESADRRLKARTLIYLRIYTMWGFAIIVNPIAKNLDQSHRKENQNFDLKHSFSQSNIHNKKYVYAYYPRVGAVRRY